MNARQIRIAVGTVVIFIVILGITWGAFRMRRLFVGDVFSDVQSRGEVIIGAVENYRNDHLRPPPDLETLVPKYLVALPTTHREDTKWGYNTWGTKESGFHFGLEVRIGDTKFRYSSKQKSWSKNDSSF